MEDGREEGCCTALTYFSWCNPSAEGQVGCVLLIIRREGILDGLYLDCCELEFGCTSKRRVVFVEV